MNEPESHDREFFRAMEMHLEASHLLLEAGRDAATTSNHMAIYHAGYAVEFALKGRYLRIQKRSHQKRVVADVFMGGEVNVARRASKKQDERTAAIYEALATQFPDLDPRPKEVVYVYNPVAIRVRVVDESFAGQSYSQRHRRVMKALSPLPEEIVGDITMVLVLTPSEIEKQQSLVNLEFDDPSRSRL